MHRCRPGGVPAPPYADVGVVGRGSGRRVLSDRQVGSGSAGVGGAALAGHCRCALSQASQVGVGRGSTVSRRSDLPRRPPPVSAPPAGPGARCPASAMEPGELRMLDALAYLMGFAGCAFFLLLQRLASPYGRYASEWPGPRIPARTAWVLQELPALAWPLLECACAAAPRLDRLPNRVLLAMFVVHYVHRALIFPFLIRGGKPTPLFTCVSAFLFCVYNGYLQSRYLSRYAVYTEDWVTQPRFLAGCALWLTGMVVNIHSDHILRNLRKPEETGYKIPRGGLFDYVTAANYLGEIVEWCGFALASWSLQGGAFALFTFTVLYPRAEQHHRWYLEKFEDYPKSRKVIIPFLY
ncbi:3-oxo-5-alpha-steroid 4-dehydrogenase 1 [Cavia porcellus]